MIGLFEEVVELNEKMIEFIRDEELDSIDEIISKREKIIKTMKEADSGFEVSESLKLRMQEQDDIINSLLKKSMRQAKEEISKIAQNRKANLRYNYVQNNYKKIYKKV